MGALVDSSGTKGIDWRWRARRGFNTTILGEVDGNRGGIFDLVSHGNEFAFISVKDFCWTELIEYQDAAGLGTVILGR